MWSINSISKPKALRRGLGLLTIALFIGLSGCTGIRNMATGLGWNDADKQAVASAKPKVPSFGDVLAASYSAADAMAADLYVKAGKTSGAILAASFVNINDLSETSPLGRVLAEQISSRMAQNGFRMLEVKLRQNSIYIKEGAGEFMLSRQLQEIGQTHQSDFVVVGTYTVAERGIYISARIVDAADSTIVTGYDCRLARNYQTDSLLPESPAESEEDLFSVSSLQ